MKSKKKASLSNLKFKSIKSVTIILILLAIPVTIIAAHQVQNMQQNAEMLAYPPLGSGVVGPIQQNTQTVPPGCYAVACTIACPISNPNCCPRRYVCPSGTPPTCVPRPSCLDANPPCLPPVPPGGWCLSGTPSPSVTCMPMPPQCKPGSPLMINCPNPPSGGWCPPTITPPTSITPPISITPPPGCQYVNNRYCTIACPRNNPFCCPPILKCQSGTPIPQPTCIPRPPCLDKKPACVLPQPAGGWCPSTNQPISSSGISSIMIFLNTFLRNLVGHQ